ncbi:MAG TPA: helix-turn-helix transcriptional regulator [Firmicutes bacterium]|nr:helix-turn-helix transcriptional regulator [Bacillota bacterium]
MWGDESVKQQRATLGDRIQELRRAQGFSQEDLAERLNVSRQAVSKWETGLSSPDTDNLILLASLFEISVDELVGIETRQTPPGKEATGRRNTGMTNAYGVARVIITFMTIALLVVIVIVAASIWFLSIRGERPDEELTQGEYALSWDSGSRRVSLHIGPQEGQFPWNTGLSGDDTFFTSGDMPGAEFHTVNCDNISIDYSRNIETGREFVTSIRTTSLAYSTSRGIRPSDTEMELIAAYGDSLLVKPEYYSSKNEFCMYNTVYAFSEETDGYNFLIFYVLDGQITGIEARAAGDGSPAFYVDNVHSFRLVNGKPDYSQKQDPDLETVSKERRVYIALHTLLNYSLTDKDAAPHRDTVFSGLRFVDWEAYGKLGELGKDADTVQQLFTWIKEQEAYSESEIIDLQLALLSNLEETYADMYSSVLCYVFLKEPAVFIECLRINPDNAENSKRVAELTAYGAASEGVLEEVKATLQEWIDCGALTDGAVPWAELILQYCDETYGEAG